MRCNVCTRGQIIFKGYDEDPGEETEDEEGKPISVTGVYECKMCDFCGNLVHTFMYWAKNENAPPVTPKAQEFFDGRKWRNRK